MPLSNSRQTYAVSDHDPHASFIKTPRQLIVVIVLSFLVPIVAIILLVQLVVSHPAADPNAMTDEAIATRLRPVGRVEFGAAVAAAGSKAPAAPKSQAPAASATPRKPDGKKVYDTTCMVCHATGVAGAPKFGDKAAWAPHLVHGMDALLQSALKGKGAMPPKGGNPSLSDDDVRAAVEFMVSQSK
jgi:cytochrome c5